MRSEDQAQRSNSADRPAQREIDVVKLGLDAVADGKGLSSSLPASALIALLATCASNQLSRLNATGWQSALPPPAGSARHRMTVSARASVVEVSSSFCSSAGKPSNTMQYRCVRNATCARDGLDLSDGHRSVKRGKPRGCMGCHSTDLLFDPNWECHRLALKATEQRCGCPAISWRNGAAILLVPRCKP